MPRPSRLSQPFLDEAVPADAQTSVLNANPATRYTTFLSGDMRVEQSIKSDHDQLATMGFDAHPLLKIETQIVLVHAGQSKHQNFGNLARATTEKTAVVVVDGGKRDGISSLEKQVSKYKPILGVEARDHGRTFWFAAQSGDPFPDAWLAYAEPSKNTDGYLSQPGCFSADGVDPGSALLAKAFDGQLSGDVCDLGCGWGWLSAQAQLQSPKSITLIDANFDAVECARLNVATPTATFEWIDVLTMPTAPRFDHIIMNPPFHKGADANTSIGKTFIAKAASLLRAKGQLWMVANRHLPYEPSLAEVFRKSATLDQSSHFKVLWGQFPNTSKQFQPAKR
jgi:16S rRNA (guanine1207-N2)-methyltransferase